MGERDYSLDRDLKFTMEQPNGSIKIKKIKESKITKHNNKKEIKTIESCVDHFTFEGFKINYYIALRARRQISFQSLTEFEPIIIFYFSWNHKKLQVFWWFREYLLLPPLSKNHYHFYALDTKNGIIEYGLKKFKNSQVFNKSYEYNK